MPIDLLPNCYSYPISFVDSTQFCLQKSTSQTELLGKVLQHTDAVCLQNLASHLDLQLQHFAAWDRSFYGEVRVYTNVYGPLRYLEIVKQLDLRLEYPRHCNQNVEYHNPRLWFFPRDPNGRAYLTWDLWKLGEEFTSTVERSIEDVLGTA